jgi:hypothetical protein
MRFNFLVSAAVLCSAAWLFAQETKEPAPAADQEMTTDAVPAPEAAPAPAPAPEPAPAPVVAPAPAPAGIQATFYGLGMTRIREIVYSNSRKDGGTESATDFQYKLAYKVGVKVKVNEEVSGQFEIGNDWYACETIDATKKGNLYNTRLNLYPYFSLAYMKWNPGCMYMDVGIIPVGGSSLLDLIGNGMLWGANSGSAYKMAAHIPWGVITNFSVPGMRIGMPILKDEFKLGIDVTSTILEERGMVAKIPDSLVHKNSAIMVMVDFPMSTGALTLKPTLIMNFNRFYNDSLKPSTFNNKSDNELGAGLEVGYKINPSACVRGGVGYAQMSNENSRLSTDPAIDEQGMNGNIGATLKYGPGKIDVDFNISTDENKKITDSRVAYPFVDLKYGWAVNKNFIIMPRTRLFFTTPAKNDATYKSKFYMWPEVMLFGTF